MQHMNEKLGGVAGDRVMTPVEQVTMPIEMEEAAIMRAIEVAKKMGLPALGLVGRLGDLEVNRRILIWLDSFADATEKAEALERITREGLPPEVFKDESNFIIEGTHTIN
jgi:hypothetical protein